MCQYFKKWGKDIKIYLRKINGVSSPKNGSIRQHIPEMMKTFTFKYI